MPNVTCVCDEGFTGEDCGMRTLCPPGCEAHGVCASDLSCVCHPGWSGEACASRLLCPNDCSNHGLCLDGVCSCDFGYSSFDCSEVAAPQRPPVAPEIRHWVQEATGSKVHTLAQAGYNPQFGPRDYGKATGIASERPPKAKAKATALTALTPRNELVEGAI